MIEKKDGGLHMNVRKRSGKVVPFDPGFISRAISLAAAAAGEHGLELDLEEPSQGVPP